VVSHTIRDLLAGMRTQLLIVGCLAACLAPSSASAQFKNGNQTVLLELPRVSQRAVLTQRIGLTDVTITYHRPQSKGRKIFGNLVSYDRVWRAGANDNTIIEFTHPVTVEGQSLAAGRYGLHMVPGEKEWVVIFSTNSTSWGSFFYDKKEDALRVTVKPRQITMRETLRYEFDDLMPESAVISKEITLTALRNQMRHLAGYKSETYYEAAMYCLDNDFNYDEALGWVEQAIASNEARFENLELKSKLLERLGRTKEAAETHAEALSLATPQQKYMLGDRLLREGKLDDAERVFTEVSKANPEAFMHFYGLARIHVKRGNKEAARKSLEQAMEHAPTPQNKAAMKRMLERLANGQTIDG
jgi:tetratricopeptide (TPR) repeat protein